MPISPPSCWFISDDTPDLLLPPAASCCGILSPNGAAGVADPGPESRAAPLLLNETSLFSSSFSQLCLTASIALRTSTVSARDTALFFIIAAPGVHAAGVAAAVLTAGDSSCDGACEASSSGILSLGGLLLLALLLALLPAVLGRLMLAQASSPAVASAAASTPGAAAAS
jgi:hypothetical protein